MSKTWTDKAFRRKSHLEPSETSHKHMRRQAQLWRKGRAKVIPYHAEDLEELEGLVLNREPIDAKGEG